MHFAAAQHLSVPRRANGKPPKVAHVACMRKLLTILNAMVRDGREWGPSIPLDQLRLQHSC